MYTSKLRKNFTHFLNHTIFIVQFLMILLFFIFILVLLSAIIMIICHKIEVLNITGTLSKLLNISDYITVFVSKIREYLLNILKTQQIILKSSKFDGYLINCLDYLIVMLNNTKEIYQMEIIDSTGYVYQQEMMSVFSEKKQFGETSNNNSSRTGKKIPYDEKFRTDEGKVRKKEELPLKEAVITKEDENIIENKQPDKKEDDRPFYKKKKFWLILGGSIFGTLVALFLIGKYVPPPSDDTINSLNRELDNRAGVPSWWPRPGRGGGAGTTAAVVTTDAVAVDSSTVVVSSTYFITGLFAAIKGLFFNAPNVVADVASDAVVTTAAAARPTITTTTISSEIIDSMQNARHITSALHSANIADKEAAVRYEYLNAVFNRLNGIRNNVKSQLIFLKTTGHEFLITSAKRKYLLAFIDCSYRVPALKAAFLDVKNTSAILKEARSIYCQASFNVLMSMSSLNVGDDVQSTLDILELYFKNSENPQDDAYAKFVSVLIMYGYGNDSDFNSNFTAFNNAKNYIASHFVRK